MLLVLTQLNFPILFRQPRTGLNGKIFNIYKFRTMTDDCDKDGILLPDELRLTKFGKFLRVFKRTFNYIIRVMNA